MSELFELRFRRDSAATNNRQLFSEVADESLQLAKRAEFSSIVAGHGAPVAVCSGSCLFALRFLCRVECDPHDGTSIAMRDCDIRPRRPRRYTDRRGRAPRASLPPRSE